MKNGIMSQIYYQLLQWKDNNLEKFQELYPNKALNDLTQKELLALRKHIKSLLK